jgi:hypothetical protein
MRFVALSLGVLLLSAPAFAGERSKTDYTLAGAFAVLHWADWRQTSDAISQPDRYEEANPLLGKNPSQAELDRFMIVGALIVGGIAILLDDVNRTNFLIGMVIVKSIAVGHNYSIGLRFGF